MTTDASDTVRQTMTLDLDAMDALAKEAKHMEAYETPWCFPVDDATALIAHVRALRAGPEECRLTRAERHAITVCAEEARLNRPNEYRVARALLDRDLALRELVAIYLVASK
jgi:hypothetical protein